MSAQAMVTYEVITIVEPDLVEDYEHFMRQRHVPDLLATGCFHAAELARAAPGRYRMRYEAATQADLDRYLDQHAAGLREHFTSHFPRGVTASREVWVAMQRWNASAENSETA
jgi:hypothetical protein